MLSEAHGIFRPNCGVWSVTRKYQSGLAWISWFWHFSCFSKLSLCFCLIYSNSDSCLPTCQKAKKSKEEEKWREETWRHFSHGFVFSSSNLTNDGSVYSLRTHRVGGWFVTFFWRSFIPRVFFFLISVGNDSLPLSLRPGKLHFFSQVIFRGIPGWVVGIVLMDWC